MKRSKVVEMPTSVTQKADIAAKVAYKESIAYDSNGEVLYDVIKRPNSQNGSGFVISYSEKMSDFLLKVKTGSIVRVFLYIAHHQAFGSDGVQFGYRCTHKYLQQIFGMDKSTLWDALKYLKENFLVNESKIEGSTEFMVNPQYVTVGSDKKARVREWNRRWEEHWKRTNQSR